MALGDVGVSVAGDELDGEGFGDGEAGDGADEEGEKGEEEVDDLHFGQLVLLIWLGD